ncbi:MAG: TIGR02453 family protein, partial [Planctomycetales bacterium]|nr:TIGR02453 family protein [Planctomycetales bacterium]
MMKFQGFPSDTISFLEDLRENNNRPWFAENKERYEASLLTPALQLIASLEKPLAKVAPLLRVEAKKVGGSLMRIYKDTRFSADKTPYKTNLGIQFRHQAGKDVHAPGVYLHVDPQEAFLAVGTWRPPSEALKKIRGSIVEHEANWRRLLKAKRFND